MYLFCVITGFWPAVTDVVSLDLSLCVRPPWCVCSLLFVFALLKFDICACSGISDILSPSASPVTVGAQLPSRPSDH